MSPDKPRVKIGFMLVELLAVLTIIGSAAGISVMAFSDSIARERRMVRNEAQDFSLWIKHRMALAARESVEFRVMLTQGKDRNYEMTLIWFGGMKSLQHEVFTFGDAALAYEGVGELIFSGRWFTMTPAATFIVKSKKSPEVRFFVTISGVGYVDIKERL